jgi:hypothetical protein
LIPKIASIELIKRMEQQKEKTKLGLLKKEKHKYSVSIES